MKKNYIKNIRPMTAFEKVYLGLEIFLYVFSAALLVTAGIGRFDSAFAQSSVVLAGIALMEGLMVRNYRKEDQKRKQKEKIKGEDKRRL